jgi:hypothetical protein
MEMVAAAVSDCPDPPSLFEHLGIHFGFKTTGRPVVMRVTQVEGLLPYLDYLDDMTIHGIWDVCNDYGWFDLRKRYIDARLQKDRGDLRYTNDVLATAELDNNLAKGEVHWGDLWLDRFIKSGASVEHVMSVVGGWIRRQKDIAALELAANIVIHAGRRNDIEMLKAYTAGPPDVAAAIIANASYAVSRRTLL